MRDRFSATPLTLTYLDDSKNNQNNNYPTRLTDSRECAGLTYRLADRPAVRPAVRLAFRLAVRPAFRPA